MISCQSCRASRAAFPFARCQLSRQERYSAPAGAVTREKFEAGLRA